MWLLFLISSFVQFLPEYTANLHKFHVSRCMVEYNPDAQALQMSMHIFLDDLEDALAQEGADSLFLCTRMEKENAEEYLRQYLNKQLSFQIDGVNAHFNFLGKEISEDYLAVWCYLEITDLPPFKELTIRNAVLLDLYDDQKNIMHIIGPQRKEGTLLFRKGVSSETVNF